LIPIDFKVKLVCFDTAILPNTGTIKSGPSFHPLIYLIVEIINAPLLKTAHNFRLSVTDTSNDLQLSGT